VLVWSSIGNRLMDSVQIWVSLGDRVDSDVGRMRFAPTADLG